MDVQGTMSIQDKLERILRELYIMLSRAPVSEINRDYVVIPKKDMQAQLVNLSHTVREMMDQYEVTQQSRNRMELEAENRRMDIIRNANHQAQDIYAASVIYSEDALGRILNIIDEAEHSAREIIKRMSQELAEAQRTIRGNQVELLAYLDDMNDTAKYLKIIEERNRRLSREKAKKRQGQAGTYKRRLPDMRQAPQDAEWAEELPEEGLPEEGLPEEGLSEEGLLEEEASGEEFAKEGFAAEEASRDDDVITYEKPVIKINPEYFRKAGIPFEGDFAEDLPEETEPLPEGTAGEEGKKGFRLFGLKF